MEIQQEWNKTNLEKYLLFEYWDPYKALRILAGSLMLDCTSVDDFKGITDKQENDYQRLVEIWTSRYATVGLRSFYNDPHPPAFYIKWAIDKNSSPDWLNWAIERGLYIPMHKIVNTPQTATMKAEPSRSTRDDNWKIVARNIGSRIYKESPRLNIDKIAAKTFKEMTDRKEKGEPGMTGRGDKVPTADTIKRHALTGIKA